MYKMGKSEKQFKQAMREILIYEILTPLEKLEETKYLSFTNEQLEERIKSMKKLGDFKKDLLGEWDNDK